MAMGMPDLSGTGIQAELRPVWIQGASKKQNHLVHPAYLARAHTRDDMSALVTYRGVAVSEGGEALTVGLVPQWRRYAIGPVVGGRAELLSQEEFEREEQRVYLDTFRFLGASADDHSKRPVPHVLNFVKWKHDPMSPGRICPLGTYIAPQAATGEAKQYDATNDRFVDRVTSEVEEKLRAENAAQADRLASLESQMAKLTGTKVGPVRRERVAARCGKQIDPKYLKNHERFCKRGCQDAEA